ncbi:uncharacterized protein LOC126744872 [Anthonomus grandis grandis]|uniref:uncharacterized protein LOC126744872 n=1 Tax=Anthonomus grandis grandis TaxID=2921223 RepID=UPI0021666CFC|nr:uncharacterized protein LOC126744872 [Anthonomus grandis grandis]
MDKKTEDQLLKWYDNLESDQGEDILGGQETDEEDDLHISDHDSASEEDPFEENEAIMNIPDDIFLSNFVRHYVGRDGTKWNKDRPSQNVRTPKHNKVTDRHKPGVRPEAKHAKAPLESLSLFLSNDLLQKIVDYSNIYIDKIKRQYSRGRDALHTNLHEIKAVIGLLYLAGVAKSSHVNIYDLWATDGMGLDIFPAVMSISRFKFLMRCLRFDNILDRQERKLEDKLAPVRDMFEDFVQKCQNMYTVSENVTTDEMLEAFRGRCGFRQYIKNKPARYGIKIFAMVDSKNLYTSNLEIYADKQPPGPYYLDNSAFEVVKRLVFPISGIGRNVTMDNWFTSVPLSEELMKNHNLTMVGTIRKNKREIPVEFCSKKKKSEIPCNTFGFKNYITLVSHTSPKKNWFYYSRQCTMMMKLLLTTTRQKALLML